MTILSKQYPMDLGTGTIEQVNQSAAKIDNEFTAIYGHLNNIRVRYRGATAPSNPEAGQLWEDTVNNKVMKWNGSAWVQDIGVSINLTNRNTVLQGTVDGSGNPTLIAGDASDLTADLVATTETIIAIPAGHEATVGNLDYIVSFSATQTDFWTSLPANNTSYLLVDYSSGTATGTYSVIAPIYQSYAPSHSAGKNWYDTNKEQWYVSDGSNWVAKYRCYVGYVVTDGTNVTATTIEPYNRIRANIIGTASLDVPLSYLDTDTTLAANSDSKIATQKAVKSYTDARQISTGAVLWFAKNTAPAGFLKANGAAISRTTYAALFAEIGTVFGVGNGTTTFNLPDLRGEFLRGWDDARGIDSGRVFGSAQADLLKTHIHIVLRDSTPFALNAGGSGYKIPFTNDGAGSEIRTDDGGGGAETRGRNIALLACIKY